MDRTAAQLSADEKNAISHRGIAFRALAPRIIEVLAGNYAWSRNVWPGDVKSSGHTGFSLL